MNDEQTAILRAARQYGEVQLHLLCSQLVEAMGGQVRRVAWEFTRAAEGLPPIDVASLRARLLAEEWKERN